MKAETTGGVNEIGLASSPLARKVDDEWRARAAKVLPHGAYAHVRPEYYPPNYAQFYDRSEGARLWDVDGNCYLDLMCSWGPMIIGYGNAEVEAAFQREIAQRDLAWGHSPRSVELAERMTGLIDHADWAMFQKNGGDATTVAVMIARQATGKRKLLKAGPSYHGATPAFTPWEKGVTPEERANIIPFTYNDIASVEAAIAQADDDFAALIILPHRHDNGTDSDPVDPAFARKVRELCDRHGAVADPRRRPRRLPQHPGRQLGAARHQARPQRLLQVHRQRPPVGGGHRGRGAGGRGDAKSTRPDRSGTARHRWPPASPASTSSSGKTARRSWRRAALS